MKKFIAIGLLTLSGCATIIDKQDQEFTVYSSSPVRGVSCNLSNEETKRFGVKLGETVKIHKDGNKLEISCKNERKTINKTIDPEIQWVYLLADVILGFPITSIAVDSYTNAFFKYDESVTINFTEN